MRLPASMEVSKVFPQNMVNPMSHGAAHMDMAAVAIMRMARRMPLSSSPSSGATAMASPGMGKVS